MHDRGTPDGDAERILKNLIYIEKAREKGADVHLVTHRMVSLLGLLVARRDGIHPADEARSLDSLAADGWPSWTITLDDGKEKTKTLGRLLWHFRNALAHGRFFPDSNSRDPEDVAVVFEDAPRDTPVNWRATLRAVDLLVFCEKLGVLITAAKTA